MNVKQLQSMIDSCNNIVFFGGAGVSTRSGIPDFRGKNGLYTSKDTKDYNTPVEYILSESCMTNEPELFYRFYKEKLDTRNAKPNKCHIKLAELEEAGKLKAVITQNIDALHQKAGSKTVFEIHGTLSRVYCTKCKNEYNMEYILNSSSLVPRCSCGGVVRPAITLYDEWLDMDVYNKATEAVKNADMLIIGGTSLMVRPASDIIDAFNGKYIAVINKGKLGKYVNANLVIDEDITEVFSKITC